MHTVIESIHGYLDYCEKQKRLSKNTLRAYRIDFSQFITFLNTECLDQKEASKISKEDIKKYVNQITAIYAPRTCKRKIACIKAFFNYMEFEDTIPSNPFRKIKVRLREGRYLPKTIRKSDVSLQLKYAYHLAAGAKTVFQEFVSRRLIACYEMLVGTGIRIGELCRLKSDCIDFDNHTIRIIGKGSKERIVYLSSGLLIDAMLEYARIRNDLKVDSDYFFVGWRRKRMSEESVRAKIASISKKTLGKRITPHMFRHTFATALLEKKVDIRYIQEVLGHSSIKTTMIYLHIANTSVRDAIVQANLREQYQI